MSRRRTDRGWCYICPLISRHNSMGHVLDRSLWVHPLLLYLEVHIKTEEDQQESYKIRLGHADILPVCWVHPLVNVFFIWPVDDLGMYAMDIVLVSVGHLSPCSAPNAPVLQISPVCSNHQCSGEETSLTKCQVSSKVQKLVHESVHHHRALDSGYFVIFGFQRKLGHCKLLPSMVLWFGQHYQFSFLYHSHSICRSEAQWY